MMSLVRVDGRKMMWIALAVVAACASTSKDSRPDGVSGHWMGVIDRDGWERPLWLDIENAHGAYAGSWMSMESQPAVLIDRLDVDGDTVAFQLGRLSFDGRINGRTLAGSVTDSASGSSSGQFTLTRSVPRAGAPFNCETDVVSCGIGP